MPKHSQNQSSGSQVIVNYKGKDGSQDKKNVIFLS